jgi:hypothetical protein
MVADAQWVRNCSGRVTAHKGDRVRHHWTFTGTNSGPGGTGDKVQIDGYEDWRIGPDGLIADSKGHYDAQDWDRQVRRH